MFRVQSGNFHVAFQFGDISQRTPSIEGLNLVFTSDASHRCYQKQLTALLFFLREEIYVVFSRMM